ncbi:MAG: hypothetical protein KF681_01075 [Bdellovibrionaceae bacterium]|nr:hypothetical protein [Pseudobdellovibrionaceae bacterium]
MNSALFKMILLSMIFANVSCALKTKTRERPAIPTQTSEMNEHTGPADKVAATTEPAAASTEPVATETPAAPAAEPAPVDVAVAAPTEPIPVETSSSNLDEGPSIQLKKIDTSTKSTPAPAKGKAILIGGATTATAEPAKVDDNSAAVAAAIEAATSARPRVSNVEPQKVLKWLQNGNRRFVKGFLRKDGQAAADRKRTATAAKPHAVVFASSDSRVPPELVFDQKLGEITVIRTQGLSLDAAALGSIETAAEDQGVRLIVVLGNTFSDAVRSAMSQAPDHDYGSPSMNHVMSDVRERLADVVGTKPSSKDMALESWLNTRRAASDLVKRSAMLETSAKSGQVVIRSAMYHAETGTVEFE